MKNNLGSVLALYPTPVVVVGTMNGKKPNWTLVAHVGIIGHDRLMISVMKEHFCSHLIDSKKKLSLNIVTKDWLELADYVGCNSGAKVDKSGLFLWQLGPNGTPVIETAKLALECQLEDVYDHPVFNNYILSIKATLAEEDILDEKGKIDYNILKPVLFEFPTYSYLQTGEILGKCRQMHEAGADEDKIIL